MIRGTSSARAAARRSASCSPARARRSSHTSSVRAAASSGRPPRLLQQGVALLEDAFDVAAHHVGLVVEARGGVVQPPAPLPRPALHQHQIVGAEQRDGEGVEQVAATLDRLPVELDAVATPHRQLGFEQQGAGAPCGLGPDHGPVGTDADHGLGGRPAQRRAGQVGHRLEQVGLALPVLPDDGGGPWRELDVDLAVAAEVGQPEVSEMQCHYSQTNAEHSSGSSPTRARIIAPGPASAGTGSRRTPGCGPPRASTSRWWPA